MSGGSALGRGYAGEAPPPLHGSSLRVLKRLGVDLTAELMPPSGSAFEMSGGSALGRGYAEEAPPPLHDPVSA